MGVSKVVVGDEVKIDLTADTVTTDTLLAGVTAHDKTGALITGTASSGPAQKWATGTANGNDTATFAVSGLDFTPTYVAIVLYTIVNGFFRRNLGGVITTSGGQVVANDKSVTATVNLTAGGFSITGPSGYVWGNNFQYRWIAVG